MDDILTEVISSLASRALYSAILLAITGGVLSAFKPFVIGEDDLRKRVELHKQKLVAKVRLSYRKILGDAFGTMTSISDPDPLEVHAEEMFRVFNVLNSLDRLRFTVARCYTWLSVTICLGVGGFLLSWTGDLLKACIALLCGFAIISQVVVFYVLRRVVIRLGECEQMT